MPQEGEHETAVWLRENTTKPLDWRRHTYATKCRTLVYAFYENRERYLEICFHT